MEGRDLPTVFATSESATVTSEPGPPGPTPRPHVFRPEWVIAFALAAALLIVAATVLTAPRPVPGADEVHVVAINFSVVFTNAPAGPAPQSDFRFEYGLGNGTTESPTIISLNAPPGIVMWYNLGILYEPGLPGSPTNCSVNAISVSSPFVVTSIAGAVETRTWANPPFPLDFYGLGLPAGTTIYADVLMNVTLPSQSGAYAPTTVLSTSCESYS